MKVGELAQGNPVTTGADNSVDEAIRTMTDHQVRHLPAIDGHDLVGMISQADTTRSMPGGRVGEKAQLVNPATGTPCSAVDVVAHLVQVVRPVLAEQQEKAAVEAVVAEILCHDSGARHQPEAYAARHDPADVVAAALVDTHRPAPGPEGWQVIPAVRQCHRTRPPPGSPPAMTALVPPRSGRWPLVRPGCGTVA
ncbi:CBS domain-containing protein [Kocuria himachalensis]